MGYDDACYYYGSALQGVEYVGGEEGMLGEGVFDLLFGSVWKLIVA